MSSTLLYSMALVTVENKNWKKHRIEYLAAIHRCMRLVWIWPPKVYDSLYIYKAFANITLLLYYIFGVLMYLIAVVTDPDAKYQEKIDAASMTMAVLTLLFEYIVSIYLSKRSLALFQLIENFNNFGVPPNILAVNQYANRISLFLFMYCLVASLTIGFEAVINIRRSEKKERSKYTICGFATVLRYPYDIGDGFLYYFHLTMEIYSFSMLCTGGVSFSCACISAIEFIVARMDHFKELLMAVFKDRNPDRAKLRLYVRYHAYIIELVTKFNNCYRIATAPALFNYSAVLGLTMLSFFADQNIKTTIHPLGWFMAILCLCHEGEKLIQHSTSVAKLLYELEWYAVDLAVQKDILFMMMRSQKALVFESGPLGEFSLATMKRIVQGAYTYKTLSSRFDSSR